MLEEAMDTNLFGYPKYHGYWYALRLKSDPAFQYVIVFHHYSDEIKDTYWVGVESNLIISFEEVLDRSSDEAKEALLFHLDLFT